MKIALVSLNQIWEDKKANLELCKDYIKQAHKENVEIIIFPEMTLSGFSNNTSLIAENKKTSQSIKNFSEFAKKFNISIVFGLVIKKYNKFFNKCIFINHKGKILGDYSKIHLFSFANEDKYFTAENKLSILKYKELNIGLTICYDLRFPELYSALSKKCDMIINIANWPKTRIEHWNTLLKARAIENQTYIIAVNRTGADGNGLKYKQSSQILNKDAKKLPFKKINSMKIYKLDKNLIKNLKEFNTKDDRKIEFYKEIL